MAPGLNSLAAAVALVSHHDAVTGTARQHTSNDYARRLSMGTANGEVLLDMALKKLLDFSKNAGESTQSFVMCRLLNESLCEPTQLPFSAPNVTEAGAVIYMAAYNPLSYTTTHRVRLPIVKKSNALVEVVDLSNNFSISANILPSTSWASEEQRMALNSLPNYPKLALHSLVFDTIIPPLGFATYAIEIQRQKHAATNSDYSAVSIDELEQSYLFSLKTS